MKREKTIYSHQNQLRLYFFGLEPVEPNYGLMTTMDMDESAGHGCALQCAMISPKFNVKAFEIQHGTQYPITISWDQTDVVEAADENKMEVEEEDGGAGVESKGVNSLTLFSKNGISGTRKINFRRNKVSIKHIDIQNIERQTVILTDRQTDTQTHRQTDINRYIYIL